jgi:uncharacterized membrane protein
MGLLVMILGLVLFLGVHTLTTQRTLRARVIAATGEGGYKIGYALVSLLGLVLIVRGFADYRATVMWELWTPPKALKHITEALMLPAVILVVAAYIRGRIYAAVKHPMLSGVKLWAAAHLLANGDLGGIILFGSFRRRAADPGRRRWQRPDRVGGRHRRLSGARLCVSSRRDRRSRVRSLKCQSSRLSNARPRRIFAPARMASRS